MAVIFFGEYKLNDFKMLAHRRSWYECSWYLLAECLGRLVKGESVFWE